MAGIYIHIPFCAQRCAYCDFHTSPYLGNKDAVVEAMHKEILIRKDYLNGEKIETIYFGGGTPSLLSVSQVESFLEKIRSLFHVVENAEITLEANPDDLTADYIRGLRSIGVNRLSMGIQSFDDEVLSFMNRRHSSKEAIQAVDNAVNNGIENLSIDLIYGVPGLSEQLWINSINKALELPVQHISAYHLTYHKGTKFYRDLKKGLFKEVEENTSLDHFKTLISSTKEKGFDHYEVSNFAKPGFYSKHNSSYWLQKNYLGIGPSAHSYDGNSREWNIAHNKKYVDNINSNGEFSEKETLSNVDKYNDYVITVFRTIWGIDIKFIELTFGIQYANYFKQQVNSYISKGDVLLDNSTFKLSPQGIFISDMIISDLFFLDE